MITYFGYENVIVVCNPVFFRNVGESIQLSLIACLNISLKLMFQKYNSTKTMINRFY